MDGGAWWAVVHAVTIWTQLSVRACVRVCVCVCVCVSPGEFPGDPVVRSLSFHWWGQEPRGLPLWLTW